MNEDQLALDVDDGVESSAVIDGPYRYELIRRFSAGPLLEWVMLNPSTADASQDDPTIRRCIGFARDWGFHGIRVTNLFAYRSTDPGVLADSTIDPFGPDNLRYLGAEYGPITVCAWGAHSAVAASYEDGQAVGDALSERSALMCLGYNRDGSPKHPLYVPKNTGLRPWPKPEGAVY